MDNSFENIYETYSHLLDSMSNKVVEKYHLSNSDFDDLRQEASIALYNATRTYTPGNNVTFGLYAKVCIKNRLNNYIRTNYGLIVNQEVSLSEIENTASQERTPEQIAIDKDYIETLDGRIKELLTDYEYRVFKHYVYGMSYEDIAYSLSKPIKSVDNAIHRLKTKLKVLKFK